VGLSKAVDINRAGGESSGREAVGRKLALNFQVKMQGFMHFYCEKLYLWPKTWTGELNRTTGAEDAKNARRLKV